MVDRKPVFIGVNVDRVAHRGRASTLFLEGGYCKAISKTGAVPLMLPPTLERDEDLSQVLDLLDGVVLCGGADLDCRRDGFMLHPSMRLLDPGREGFDRRLVDMVARRKIPVFGIGCGVQLLNVSQGGNLFLHIPEDLPHALPHLDATDPGHRHALEVMPDSVLARVYGEDNDIIVNSMHHQAIDEVAPGFRVTARSLDGVAEAIESTREDWVAFGVQFHPEHQSASALDSCLLEEFVNEIVLRGRRLARAAA